MPASVRTPGANAATSEASRWAASRRCTSACATRPSASDQFTGQRDWLYATPELRAQRDPLLLAKTASLDGLAFYLDAGNGDLLRQQDEALARILQGRGASVEFVAGSGGHDAAYWRSQLENYLRFYSKRPGS